MGIGQSIKMYIPKGNKFVNRKSEIEHVEDVLKIALKKGADSPVVYHSDIIHFYGIGGIGKSSLLNHLRKTEIKGDSMISVFYSFDASRDYSSTDIVTFLKSLATKITSASDGRIEFPLFAYALSAFLSVDSSIRYQSAATKNEDKENTKKLYGFIKGIIPSADTYLPEDILKVIPLYKQVSDVFSLMDTISKLEDSIFNRFSNGKYINNLKAVLSDQISEIEKREEVKKLMIQYFQLDLENGAHILAETDNGKKLPIVIFLDTVERYQDVCRNTGDVDWLFGTDTDTYVVNKVVDGVIWITTGREDIRKEGITNIKVDKLSKEHIRELLGNKGITDDSAVEAISAHSEGVPDFINLDAELYLQTGSVDGLEENSKNKAKKYLTYLNEHEITVIRAMAMLGHWNDEDFREFLNSNRVGIGSEYDNAYDSLSRKSFIEKREDDQMYIFHNVVRKAVYDDPDYTDGAKRNNLSHFIKHYKTKINENDNQTNYVNTRLLRLLETYDFKNDANLLNELTDLINLTSQTNAIKETCIITKKSVDNVINSRTNNQDNDGDYRCNDKTSLQKFDGEGSLNSIAKSLINVSASSNSKSVGTMDLLFRSNYENDPFKRFELKMEYYRQSKNITNSNDSLKYGFLREIYKYGPLDNNYFSVLSKMFYEVKKEFGPHSSVLKKAWKDMLWSYKNEFEKCDGYFYVSELKKLLDLYEEEFGDYDRKNALIPIKKSLFTTEERKNIYEELSKKYGKYAYWLAKEYFDLVDKKAYSSVIGEIRSYYCDDAIEILDTLNMYVESKSNNPELYIKYIEEIMSVFGPSDTIMLKVLSGTKYRLTNKNAPADKLAKKYDGIVDKVAKSIPYTKKTAEVVKTLYINHESKQTNSAKSRNYNIKDTRKKCEKLEQSLNTYRPDEEKPKLPDELWEMEVWETKTLNKKEMLKLAGEIHSIALHYSVNNNYRISQELFAYVYKVYSFFQIDDWHLMFDVVVSYSHALRETKQYEMGYELLVDFSSNYWKQYENDDDCRFETKELKEMIDYALLVKKRKDAGIFWMFKNIK